MHVCEQDVRYEVVRKEDDSGWSRDAWNSVKYELGLDFPNLPYLIDGDLKITQSNACLAYAGEKAGLGPKTAKQRAVVRAGTWAATLALLAGHAVTWTLRRRRAASPLPVQSVVGGWGSP